MHPESCQVQMILQKIKYTLRPERHEPDSMTTFFRRRTHSTSRNFFVVYLQGKLYLRVPAAGIHNLTIFLGVNWNRHISHSAYGEKIHICQTCLGFRLMRFRPHIQNACHILGPRPGVSKTTRPQSQIGPAVSATYLG